MAIVQLGTNITGISGTIGGVTYSRNRAGTIAKPWARGTNKRTDWQQATRALTSQWPQRWRDLSDGQRSDWNDLAASPPETDYDPFGNVVLRSGYNWFVRLNNRRLFTFQDPIDEAPAPVTPGAPTIASLVVSVPSGPAGDSLVTFSDTEFDAGEYLVWLMNFASGPGYPTKQSDWKLVACQESAGSTEVDASLIVFFRFGVFPAGWLATAQIFRQTADSFRSVATIMQTTVV